MLVALIQIMTDLLSDLKMQPMIALENPHYCALCGCELIECAVAGRRFDSNSGWPIKVISKKRSCPRGGDFFSGGHSLFTRDEGDPHWYDVNAYSDMSYTKLPSTRN